jgi:hypothetical protein
MILDRALDRSGVKDDQEGCIHPSRSRKTRHSDRVVVVPSWLIILWPLNTRELSHLVSISGSFSTESARSCCSTPSITGAKKLGVAQAFIILVNGIFSISSILLF